MDPFFASTNKNELNLMKNSALTILHKMLNTISVENETDDLKKKDMIKYLDIMVHMMKDEDVKYHHTYYSVNRLASIADILREFKKNKYYEKINIELFYRVMRIIYITHTSLYKHKDFASDQEFLENMSSLV